MRLIRFIIGVFLLPLCWVVTSAFISMVTVSDGVKVALVSSEILAAGGGFMLWLAIFILMPRPLRVYILAHELTHALWGWVMGARVSELKVGSDHGSVTLSETNFLIILAPYFFPLYTVILVILYYVLSLFIDVQQYDLLWLVLVGFTWAFHLTFTVNTLMQRQSDIEECGYIFSYATIYIINLVGIVFLVVSVSSVQFGLYWDFLLSSSVNTFQAVRSATTALFSWLKSFSQQ